MLIFEVPYGKWFPFTVSFTRSKAFGEENLLNQPFVVDPMGIAEDLHVNIAPFLGLKRQMFVPNMPFFVSNAPCRVCLHGLLCLCLYDCQSEGELC